MAHHLVEANPELARDERKLFTAMMKKILGPQTATTSTQRRATVEEDVIELE